MLSKFRKTKLPQICRNIGKKNVHLYFANGEGRGEPSRARRGATPPRACGVRGALPRESRAISGPAQRPACLGGKQENRGKSSCTSRLQTRGVMNVNMCVEKRHKTISCILFLSYAEGEYTFRSIRDTTSNKMSEMSHSWRIISEYHVFLFLILFPLVFFILLHADSLEVGRNAFEVNRKKSEKSKVVTEDGRGL